MQASTLPDLAKLLYKVVYQLILPPAVYEEFLSPYAFKHLVFSIFSFHQTGSEMVSCLNLQKSINVVEHLSKYLMAIWISLFL